MPIYEYQCSSCNSLFEELVSSFEKSVIPCVQCGKEAHRVVSKNSFQLKGEGWYVTEYGNKSSSSSSSSEASSSESKKK